MHKVYLYTRGVQRAHPIYRELSRYAPDDFYFHPSSNDFFAPRPLPASSNAISNFASLFQSHIPKALIIRIPHNTSLVHSGQYPILNHVPWIMDFEQAAALTWYNRNLLDKSSTKKFFSWLFARKECKGLLAWTTAAKQSLLNSFDCSSFIDKIKVAHLTIVPQKYVNRSNRNGRTELLFCSGSFYSRGGLDAILTTLELAKNYDVHLSVVSKTPSEVLKKFNGHPNITFYRNINAQERHALMRQADIFLHPAHSDTYGFVMLEAFSFGLPTISTTGYSAPELIGNGERGYVIKNHLSLFDDKFLPWIRTADDRQRFYNALLDPPQNYINDMAATIAKLIENKTLRLEMGNSAYKSVTEGMFSPSQRKKVVQEFYTNAIS